MDLLTEIKSVHRTACSAREAKRKKAIYRRDLIWRKKQKRLAKARIDKLPAKLLKAARAGKHAITIYEWTDQKQGFWENMRGVPAILDTWCKKQGIKVSHSVFREGYGPETGRLTVFLNDL